jgi:pyruvate dehydrogenase E2 component (dihydrolipoamide acetyltransferase)
MSIEEVKLPDVGGESVLIIEVSVKVGDSIDADDAIIVVETEKASMDIPAPTAGTIESLSVKAGDKISEGMIICTLKSADSSEVEKTETKEVEKVQEVQVEKTEVPVTPVKVEEKVATKQISSITEVKLPDVGGESVLVIEVSVKVGDNVDADDAILVVETEKASMDIPAPVSGTIESISIKAGDKISEGTVICTLKSSESVEIVEEEITVVKEEKAEEKVVSKEVIAVEEPSVAYKNQGKVYASPSVRRMAREYGVDLTLIKGTSEKNRVVKEDVRLFIKKQLSAPKTSSNGSSIGFGSNLPELKEIDFSKFGEIEKVELSRIQKISGPSLHRNYLAIPHVTQFDESDITELEEFRKTQNDVLTKKKADYKISPLVFALKAVAKALQIHPIFNSSLSADGQSIIYKKYINIAVAVDTPNGLVVPVIKDVDKKGIEQLSIELKEISLKARDGKLKLEDIQGACFTISSLGGIGGTSFTPIINAPEVAILGISKSQMKPVWNGEEFEPKLMLPLSLSYDHRVIDGANGARFSTTLCELLSDIRLLLI